MNIFFLLQKTNRLYALITKFSKNKVKIDTIIEKSQILKHEQRLDVHLCYVLVTELLFGAKQLNGDSKPVQCVRAYEDKFKEILAEIENDKNASSSANASASDMGIALAIII